MDHEFRKLHEGLIVLKELNERRSRDEFTVIVDKYAATAIKRHVPATLFHELAGWGRSFYTLQGHIDAILKYGSQKVPEPTDLAWNRTKQETLTMFRRYDKVCAISYETFDLVRWMSSSSAGYGYVGSKGDNDNYKAAKRTAVTIAEKLDHDRNYGPQAIINSTPDIAFTRTQLSQMKVKRKIRNVWGEAFHYVLLEGLFSQPIVQYFKSIESFYFIGYNPLYSVPALIEEIISSRDYVYMFDWSSFDATVQEWEIRFAFKCLEQMLIFPSNIESQIWRFVIELFIYRKIAGPNGVLYLKTKGIPSGSCFTNLVGSIVNYNRIQYMFYRLTGQFALVFTHGDDSLAAVDVPQYVPMNAFDDICNPLGWQINVDKSEVSRKDENISFLSRTVRERQNSRDELLCLRMLMYPEHPVPDGSISALRAKSIFIDAGVTSQFLYYIFSDLEADYGIAESLPPQLAKWDEQEFEERKSSALENL